MSQLWIFYPVAPHHLLPLPHISILLFRFSEHYSAIISILFHIHVFHKPSDTHTVHSASQDHQARFQPIHCFAAPATQFESAVRPGKKGKKIGQNCFCPCLSVSIVYIYCGCPAFLHKRICFLGHPIRKPVSKPELRIRRPRPILLPNHSRCTHHNTLHMVP